MGSNSQPWSGEGPASLVLDRRSYRTGCLRTLHETGLLWVVLRWFRAVFRGPELDRDQAWLGAKA